MTDTELERKWHFKYHRDCLETGNLVYGYSLATYQGALLQVSKKADASVSLCPLCPATEHRSSGPSPP